MRCSIHEFSKSIDFFKWNHPSHHFYQWVLLQLHLFDKSKWTLKNEFESNQLFKTIIDTSNMFSLLIKEFLCLINLFLDFIEHHMRGTIHFLLQIVFCFSKLDILSRLDDRNLVLLTLPFNHVNFAHYVRSLLYRLREK